jgi:putative transposase
MQLVAYKVQETRGQFLLAPTRTLKPSQRCPSCWSLRKKLLDERWHACACGHSEDRDLAAARVVLRWATGEMPGQELSPAREDVRYETPAFTPG